MFFDIHKYIFVWEYIVDQCQFYLILIEKKTFFLSIEHNKDTNYGWKVDEAVFQKKCFKK